MGGEWSKRGGMRSAYMVALNLKGRDSFQGLSCHGNSNGYSKNRISGCGLNWTGSGYGPVSLKMIDPLGFRKTRVFLDHLNCAYCQIFKEDVPWSYF
jgi:hypothetical protein